MERNCLMISDEILINKLESFLYDYSGFEYNNLDIVVNHFIGNKNDEERIKNKDNIYELRKMLSYHSTDTQLEEKTLDKAIDLFLLFLRTYNIEATMGLNGLLDIIWKSGKEGNKWNCVKRITGILAAVYLLYFVQKAKIYYKNETEKNMREIFRKNISFYSMEDKRFLTQMFMLENQIDCLIYLLHSNLKGCDKSEKYTIDSERIMAKEFFRILKKFKNAEKYKDAMFFLEESEKLFRRVSDLEIRGFWEKQKAELLFDLGEYEEAKNIQNKYINAFGESKNVFDLYNGAIYYAWAANYKEKDDADWEIYIEKAYQLIIQAEQYILQAKELQKTEYKEFLYHVILEKSFLLSEMGDYDKAFECFEQAFSEADKETKEDSNFNTHLWVLMKYMCLNPEKHEIVISWIEHLYNDFSQKRLKEYEVILDFVHSSKYLKNNSKIYTKIYEGLIQLLFHALEIRHETKIRDISQYDVLYYTKTEHLRLLLEDESSENCHYRLPMFHVYHMNDPQEGKIIRGLLENDKFASVDTEDFSDFRNQYEENYVFLKSFFCYPKKSKENSMKEFLPMWVQYGDDAKGCCIVLNNKTFENSSLRRIIYLTDDGKCDKKDEKVKIFLDEFLFTYRDLVSFCNHEIDLNSVEGKECFLEIKSLTKYIISQISYLFKNQSYKHENEIRLIANRTSAELDDVKVISGSIPKIYIYNNSQTYINEVILGAKIENPEDYVSFIYKQGNKMWKDDKQSQIKVTQSTIQYR